MDLSQSRTKQLITFLMSSCILMVLMFSLSAFAEDSTGFSSLSDFKGKKISMLTGTSFDVHMEKNEILKGDVDILMQNSTVDSISSVISGKSDAVIMMDDSLMAPEGVAAERVIAIPILRTARETVGKAFTANIVAVGAINEALRLFSAEELTAAVERHIPAGTEEINRKALAAGAALIGDEVAARFGGRLG